MVVGLVMLLLSIAGFIGSVALFDRVGEPVLSLPIALLIVGVVGMITGASLSPLSEEGHRRAERWRAFKRTLGNASEASAGGAPGVQHVEQLAAVRGGLRHGPRVDEAPAEAGGHGRPVLARSRHP